MKTIKYFWLIILIPTLFNANLIAQERRIVEYDLVVTDTIVDFTGKKCK